MMRTLTNQRLYLAGFCSAAALALLLATPVHAQERMRILVPALEGQARGNPGEQIADRVRRNIDQLATHAAVSNNDYRDALRQVGRRAPDMDCISHRQLASHMEVPLVMCGSFEQVDGGVRVEARVIAARTGEEFVIEPFVAPNTNAAGEHIADAFRTYVDFLRASTFCGQYLSSEQWENALNNCNQALELNPGTESVQVMKARALMELERLEESLALHEEILERNPFHQDALYTAAFVAARLGRMDQSLQLFRNYLELDPANVDVRLQIAIDLNREGNPEGALRLAEEGFEFAPDDLRLVEYAGHFALNAATRMQQGNGALVADGAYIALLDKALEYYSRVFDDQGEEAQPLMLRNMLRVFLRLDRDDDAASFGARAVAARDDDADLWSSYADALQRVGRVDDALDALDRVAELNPDADRIYARRAQMLLRSERLEDALQEFQRSIGSGEISRDDAATQIFAFGYNELYQQQRQGDAYAYLAAARELAESPERRGAPAFFMGFIEYQRGMAAQDQNNPTLDGANRALPLFRRGLELMNESRAWVQTQPSVQGNHAQIVDALNRLIEIQELIIQRGR